MLQMKMKFYLMKHILPYGMPKTDGSVGHCVMLELKLSATPPPRSTVYFKLFKRYTQSLLTWLKFSSGNLQQKQWYGKGNILPVSEHFLYRTTFFNVPLMFSD